MKIENQEKINERQKDKWEEVRNGRNENVKEKLTIEKITQRRTVNLLLNNVKKTKSPVCKGLTSISIKDYRKIPVISSPLSPTGY